jgi:isopenicillin N synthase-like dioxygenase
MPAGALLHLSLQSAKHEPDRFAARLGDALQATGFAVITDHGLPQELIDECLRHFRLFFSYSTTEKLRYHRVGSGGARGYTPFGVEIAKGATQPDLKEFWHMGRELDANHRYRSMMPPNVWVEQIPGFQSTLTALYTAFDQLGRQLLASIARYLGLAEDWFEHAVATGNSVLRVLHYPPTTGIATGLRAEPHEDINVITLLLGADEAGLQIRTQDGTWLNCNPPANSLVCNVGDMLSRLSNNRLPSASHRVINPTGEQAARSRYALPYFLHFNPDYLIQTLPNCITAQRPNRYPNAITANEFLHNRLHEIGLL